jgi:hypothetical protein
MCEWEVENSQNLFENIWFKCNLINLIKTVNTTQIYPY